MNRGLLVKTVRKHMKLSQWAFSEYMGVTTTMVSKWENEVNHFEDSRVFELYYICCNYTTLNTKILFDKIIADIMSKRL